MKKILVDVLYKKNLPYDLGEGRCLGGYRTGKGDHW